MKNFTLTLALVFSFLFSAHAAAYDSLLEKQLDSIHYALLKPRMANYIARAEALSDKIKASSDKKEIRHYARQLYQMTDSLKQTADRIYGYKRTSTNGTAFAILPNGQLAYAYVLSPDVVTGVRPTVHDALEDLSSAAGTMNCFPGSKASRLRKIDQLIVDLKTF